MHRGSDNEDRINERKVVHDPVILVITGHRPHLV